MNAIQKNIDNELDKINIELAMYLSKEEIPFKILELASGNIFAVDITNCTEEQKDTFIGIENKKVPYLKLLKGL